MIDSLKETSFSKKKTVEMLELNEITSSSKIVLMYDAVREILEAIGIEKRYKFYNHICCVCFIDEILKDNKTSKIFDKVRRVRNKINYDGMKLNLVDTRDILEDLVFLYNYFRNNLYI